MLLTAVGVAAILTAGVLGVAWVIVRQQTPPAPSAPTNPTDATPPASHEPPPAEWVRRCVLVEATTPTGGAVCGSGWLADRGRRLVFTAAHLVEGAGAVRVHFPTTDPSGRLVTDPKSYLDVPAANVVRATVQVVENGVAVLKLDGPPPVTATDLPLAPGAVNLTLGRRVAVGGAAGGRLWRSLPGHVRTESAPRTVKVPAGEGDATSITARIFELRTDTPPDDCGGPVVNDRDQVVGMVIARGRQPDGTLLAVGVSELHAALTKVAGGSQPAPPSLTDQPIDAVVDVLKSGSTAVDRTRAAEELARRKSAAKPAVADLIDALTAERDSRAADAMAAALEAIGPPADSEAEILGKAARSENRRVRLYALRHYATRAATDDALAAVANLGRNAGDPEVRTAAVLALGRAGHAAARRVNAFGVLLEAADVPNPRLSEAAAVVFERFARDAAFGTADLDLLKTARKSGNPRVVRGAIVATLGLATTAKEAFAACPLELVKEGDVDFLTEVIPALSRWPLAEWPAGYWEAVFAQSTHRDKAVRLVVQRAIRELRVTSGVARRVVWLAENDPDPDVRAAAALTFAGLNVPPGEMTAGEYSEVVRRLKLPETRPKPEPKPGPRPVAVRYIITPPAKRAVPLADTADLLAYIAKNPDTLGKWVKQREALGLVVPTEVELIAREGAISRVRVDGKEWYVDSTWVVEAK